MDAVDADLHDKVTCRNGGPCGCGCGCRDLSPSRGRVAVAFSVEADVGPRDELRIVGSAEELGIWRPDSGVRLRRSDGPHGTWCATVQLPIPAPAPAVAEYKLVLVRSSGDVCWEGGANRQLVVEADGHGWVVTRFGGDVAPARPLVDPGCVVTWEAECAKTEVGDSLLVVGGCPELGAWDPAGGVQLETEPALWPLWRGRTVVRNVGGAEPMKWRLAIRRATGEVHFEDEVRSTALPWSSASHCSQATRACSTLCARFGDVEVVCGEGAAGRPAGSAAGDEFGGEDLGKFSGEASGGCLMRREVSCMSTCSTLFPEFDWSRASTNETANLDGTTSPCTSDGDLGQWFYAGAHRIGKASGPCEDAYFVGPYGIGVADGVGSMIQYKDYGVNCASYATELMENAAYTLQAAPRTPRGADSADARAYSTMAAAESMAAQYGAATMAVAQLCQQELGVAVLGDSGFMVIRQAEGCFQVAERSKEQQHGFNFPYQLMNLPPALLARAKKEKGYRSDTVADCELYRISPCSGDLILLYTDGFVDNMEESEILEVVEQFCAGVLEGSDDDPSLLAKELAEAAHRKSMNPSVDVPFGVAARAAGFEHSGGKKDDITVVAAWVATL